jgi:tetratricopeptide (TPR) repeat protein
MTSDGGYLWHTPREVGVWDAATGRAVVPPLRHRTVSEAVVAPDGKSLVVIGRYGDATGRRKPEDPANELTELSAWDLETGELRAPVVRQPGRLKPAGRTADGKRLLLLVPARVGPDGPEGVAAQLWDAGALTPDGPPFGPPRGLLTQAAVSPDGARVLTVGTDGETQVWDARTGQPVGPPFRHTSPRVGEKASVSMAAFSPDGRRVATAVGHNYGPVGETRVWDVETGRPVTPVLRAHAWVEYVAFSPDGRLLATQGAGTVRLWEADTGMPVSPPLPLPLPAAGSYWSADRDPAHRPRFTPDGRRLLVPSEDGLFVIDLTPETRPAAELGPLAQVLAGHEVDAAGGFQPLSEAAAVEARDRWRQLNPAPRVRPAPAYREELARSALAQKAWDIAVRHLGELLREHPATTWAWAERGEAREKLGHLAEARADWDEVVRRADGPTARVARGHVLARLGRYAEGAADYAAAWAATGRPGHGARLALCQWAAGDRGGYRATCEQLRDRRDEFPRTEEGLTLAALACGLAPDSADLVRPFVPLLEGLVSAERGDTGLLRPLALAYVRTGTPEKAVPRLAALNPANDSYSPHWQVWLLVMPKAGGPLGLTGLRRAELAETIDFWYEREKGKLDWTEHVIVPELQKQGR